MKQKADKGGEDDDDDFPEDMPQLSKLISHKIPSFRK